MLVRNSKVNIEIDNPSNKNIEIFLWCFPLTNNFALILSVGYEVHLKKYNNNIGSIIVILKPKLKNYNLINMFPQSKCEK